VSCEELHELAPAFALGILDGEERAEALGHLSACGQCRRLLEELSRIADELLLLAPVEEPPVGFESRVLEALGVRARRRGGWRRRLLLHLGPPTLAAAVAAVALVSIYHDDHVTAERYRETLEQAGGQYFQAEPLLDETGAEAGVAFGYQGSPSWVLVTVDANHRDRIAGAELVSEGGRTIPMRSFELDRDGSWGAAIAVDLHDVATIRLLGKRPGELLEASIPHAASEGGS
jgi:putative zinc finger protein